MVERQASKRSEGQQVLSASNRASAQEDLAERTSHDRRATDPESSAINCGGTLDYSNDNVKDEEATRERVQPQRESNELQAEPAESKEATSRDVDSAAPEQRRLSQRQEQLIELQSSELVSIERISPNRSDNMNHDEIDSNSSDVEDEYASSELRKPSNTCAWNVLFCSVNGVPWAISISSRFA